MSEQIIQTVPAAKSAKLLAQVVEMSQGPREAYGLLVIALWRLNFELIDEPSTIEDFIVEVSTSLRTLHFRDDGAVN